MNLFPPHTFLGFYSPFTAARCHSLVAESGSDGIALADKKHRGRHSYMLIYSQSKRPASLQGVLLCRKKVSLNDRRNA